MTVCTSCETEKLRRKFLNKNVKYANCIIKSIIFANRNIIVRLSNRDEIKYPTSLGFQEISFQINQLINP